MIPAMSVLDNLSILQIESFEKKQWHIHLDLSISPPSHLHFIEYWFLWLSSLPHSSIIQNQPGIRL